MNSITHRRINYVLAVLVVSLGIYIILTPYLPDLSFWWRNQKPYAEPSYVTAARQDADSGNSAETALPPSPQRIIIPSIRLDEAILTGDSESTVNQGVWLRPNTVTPDTQGNSVLVGHRFTYSPAVRDTFYHLDKVKINDEIIVYWQNQPLRYRVATIAIVPPDAVEVESQSRGDILTLYTCTPLWSSANRLVLTAVREESS